MRYLAALAVLGCMTTLVTSQAKHRSTVRSTCTMTAGELAEIRGLRLGMSVGDLLNAFPEDSTKNAIQKAITDAKKPEAYGHARGYLFRSNPEVNPNLSGVDGIDLEILDEHVSAFTIYYSRETPWDSVDQFTRRLADAFHLPTIENWGLEYGVRVLTCNGFTVAVTINNGNAITVKNVTTEQVVKDRRDAAREKVRQAFKP